MITCKTETVLKDILTRAQSSKRDLTKEDEQRAASVAGAYIAVEQQAAVRIAALESGVLGRGYSEVIGKSKSADSARWRNNKSYWLYSIG